MKINIFKLGFWVFLLVIFSPSAYSAKGPNTPVDFAEEFALAASNYDSQWLERHVDADRFIDKIAQGTGLSGNKLKRSRKNFVEEIKKKLSLALFADLKHGDGYATFLKLIEFEGEKQPIIRFDFADGSMNYLILELEQGADDRLEISDIFIASGGKHYSQTVAGIINLSVDSGTNFFEKLVGKKDMDAQIIRVFSKVSEYRLAGKYQQAYDVLMTLPDNIKHTEEILDVSFALSVALDESLYKKELNKLAKYSKNIENKSFLLVDHYFYNKEYDKALQAVNMFAEQFVEDGAINLLRSNIHYLSGDIEKATWSAFRCKALEPAYEDCYWNLITFYLETKEFDRVVQELEVLESYFMYEFKHENFKDEPLYQKFIESEEYKDWMRS